MTVLGRLYENRVLYMSCAATGEPFGKAGAYGIQGPAGCWVKRIEGEASRHVTAMLCFRAPPGLIFSAMQAHTSM